MLHSKDDANYYEFTYGPLTEEGRALAELLAYDGTLYETLRRIAYRWVSRSHDRDDFLQDFFLHITRNAAGFNESFIGVDDLREYTSGFSWVVGCMRNFVVQWWRRKKRRIKKSKGKDRAKHERIDVEYRGGRIIDRLGNASYHLWLKDKGLTFPGRDMLDTEETEYRTRQISELLEGVMPQLTLDERTVVRLYYMEGLNCPGTAKRMGSSRGSVRTRLWSARAKLRKLLPFDLMETLY